MSGSTVQLYAVGSNGNGSAATPLLTQPVVSDANGNFSLTNQFSCPTPASLTYVVATGGNPGLSQGTNNAAIAMMTSLGRCDSLTSSTFIVINELTTAAAVSALFPFMTSPANIGSSSSDASSLANAFVLASEFVNPSTGLAPGLNVPQGTIVPVAKIDSLADIVAACINSAGGASGDGSACGTLFTLTTPAGTTTAPTNVITALLNVASNPTLNTAGLFNLTTPTAPFQPQLSAIPADLSIRLTTTGSNGGSSGPVTLSPTTLNFYETNVPQTVTVTNSGSTPVVIQSINTSSSAWSQTNACGTVLQPQSICTINVQSTNSTLGTFSGTLTLVDDDTNDAQVVQLNTDNETLAGTLDYGSWPIGSTAPSPPSINITGGVLDPQTNANVLTGNLTGPNPGDFSVYDWTKGKLPSPSFSCSIASHQDCALYVLFTPSAVGTQSSLFVTNIGTYLLTGTGLPHGPHFSFESPSYDFGSASPGTPDPLQIKLISDGDAQVTLLSPVIGGTNAGDFSVTSPCGRNVLNPVVSAYVSQQHGTYIYTQGGGNRDSCLLTVTFTPSSTGPSTATLTVSDSVGLSQTITLVGNVTSNPPPVANPTSLSFGSVQLGQTNPLFMTVTSANQAAVTATILGSSDYSVHPPTTCAESATSCSFFIYFTPTSTGTITGTLSLSGQGSLTPTLVPLTGTGIQSAVSLSSTSLSFGTHNIGTTSIAQTVTLMNTGTAPLHISNVVITTATSGEFVASQSCPSAVAVGQSCALSVKFAPQVSGTRTGTLQIFSDAPSSPDTIQLSGVAQ